MENTQMILRLLTAVLCGGLIGYEREFKDKPAGFITHIMVCMGAAIIAIVQVRMVSESISLAVQNPKLVGLVGTDSGRLIAQIVSGIGFLGAGTIIHFKGRVKGLTTAATLWVVAAIGIASGLGYFLIAFVSSAFVFVILVFFKSVEHKLQMRRNAFRIEIQFVDDYMAILSPLNEILRANSVKILEISFHKNDDESPNTVYYAVITPHFVNREMLFQKISAMHGVKQVKFENDLAQG